MVKKSSKKSHFNSPMRFSHPLLPDLRKVIERFSPSWKVGMVTKGGITQEYEKKMSAYLKVRHALSVSSCTTGLVLALRALNLKGDCLVPSFTFTSTVHALIWNQLNPVFVDCHPSRFTVRAQDLSRAFTAKTSAVLVPYIFGNPPPFGEIQEFCRRKKVPLIVDAAHAFGSMVYGKKPGSFGSVEVFSTSATKLLCTGEGGIITTYDSELKETLLLLREYGHNSQYESKNLGLNGRITEFQAALGIEELSLLEEHAEKRNALAKLYQKHLAHLPVSFQEIEEGCRSSYKDFAVVLQKEEWGNNRDRLRMELERSGIPTRRYFFPPLHRQKFFGMNKGGGKRSDRLPNTEKISENILCLPMHYHLRVEEIKKVAGTMTRIFNNIRKSKRNFNEIFA